MEYAVIDHVRTVSALHVNIIIWRRLQVKMSFKTFKIISFEGNDSPD